MPRSTWILARGGASAYVESVDQTGQQAAQAATMILAIAVAVALPLLTLSRMRTPTQRRDEWLGANAQRGLTAVAHGLAIVSSLGGGLACALGAIAGHPFLWAAVALSAGVLASTIISVVVTLRTPSDLD